MDSCQVNLSVTVNICQVYLSVTVNICQVYLSASVDSCSGHCHHGGSKVDAFPSSTSGAS